jgi:hypothetical protein
MTMLKQWRRRRDGLSVFDLTYKKGRTGVTDERGDIEPLILRNVWVPLR